MILKDDKIGSITKLYKTLLYSIYLFIIRIFRTFRPAGCKTGCTGHSGLQPVVYPAPKCKRAFNVHFRDLQRPSSETSHATGSTVFMYTLCGTL